MNISQRFDPSEKQSSALGILDSFKRLKECGARGGGVKRVVTKDHFQTSGVDINQHLFEHWDPVFPTVPLYWDGHWHFLWLWQTLKPVRLNLWPCFGRGANTRSICKGYVWVKVELEVRTFQNNHGWAYKSASENRRVICRGLKGQESQVTQLES